MLGENLPAVDETKEASISVAPLVINEDLEIRSNETSASLGERSLTWIKGQEPKVTNGLTKAKKSIQEGWESFTAFSKAESKLVYSQAKWAVYCRDIERTDDSEFVNMVDLMENWKQTLKTQKIYLRKMIKSQRAYENYQEEFSVAMQKVPDQSECSKRATELGTAVYSGASDLLSTSKLEFVMSVIETLLRTKYAKLDELKKDYDTRKNHLVVFQVKLSKHEDYNMRQKVELDRLSELCTECKRKFMKYSKEVLEKHNSLLSPLYSQACQNTGGVSINL